MLLFSLLISERVNWLMMYFFDLLPLLALAQLRLMIELNGSLFLYYWTRWL